MSDMSAVSDEYEIILATFVQFGGESTTLCVCGSELAPRRKGALRRGHTCVHSIYMLAVRPQRFLLVLVGVVLPRNGDTDFCEPRNAYHLAKAAREVSQV